jgi:hypothetical protein
MNANPSSSLVSPDRSMAVRPDSVIFSWVSMSWTMAPEAGERCGQAHDHETTRQQPPLPRHGGGHHPGQHARQRSRGTGQRPPPAAEDGAGDSPGQQGSPDPEQQRRQEGRVAHRDRRHALGRQDDLVAAPHGLPEHGSGPGQQPDVEIEPRPQGPARGPDGHPGSAYREGTRVPYGRDHDRGGGQGKSGERGDPAPQDGLTRCGAESRGAESQAPGDRRAEQTDAGAEDADQQCLAPGQSDDPAGRGAPDPQQRLLAPPPVAASGADDACDHAGQHGAGQPEEQEEELRVQRVFPGRVQLGTQVVADQSGAGEPGLQVLGAGQDIGECGRGVGWQRRR